jgi:choline dehydrogenase-like flavoprotein
MNAKTRRKFIESTLANPKIEPVGLGRIIGLLLGWYYKIRESILKDLAKIKLLFIAGYYGEARVYPGINFISVETRFRHQPDKLKRLDLAPLQLYKPTTTEVRTEVCVIGSGAGGAVVAYHAATAGKNVVLLEEGKYIRSLEMTHDEGEMTAKLYKEGGLQSTVDLDMSILQGKCLGGTTAINNAICFRLNDPDLNRTDGSDILEEWRRLGANIDAKELEAAYDRVEKMIHAQRLPEGIIGENGNVLLRGWKNLRAAGKINEGYKSGIFRTNLNQCLGCGYCITGCRYERRFSMLETYIPEALKNGARVIAECHAVKIETTGSRATGVRCELGDGRKLLVRAGKIVVACGAIGSSVLLMKSGIRKNVGRRFSFNAATPMLAKFPQAINGFKGVQMAAYIDAGEFMLETLFVPPMAFAMMMPGWFNEHFERMKAYDRFACAGVLIGTEANGRVKRSSLFRNLFGPVDYRMQKADLEKMKRGMILLAQVFFAAGAESVYPATFVDLEMPASQFTTPADIEKFIHANIRRPSDLTLTSAHPQGGNSMSDNKKLGVVDSHFKVHGYDNLFVCDASVFPTAIGINPQLTIMAMADYANHIRTI